MVELAGLTLWLLDRQSGYDFRYSPDQPRDEHGRFGEGDGGNSGGPGSGRDLSGDQAMVDRLYGEATDEHGHLIDDGKGDAGLRAIAKEQGFGKPVTVSDDEFDRMTKEQGLDVLYRGVKGNEDESVSAADINAQYRNGEYQPGYGIFGNGYYAYGEADKADAEHYADGTHGSLARYALAKDAKVVEYTDVKQAWDQNINQKWDTVADSTYTMARDPGRYAALMGYDAIRISAGSNIGGRTMEKTQYVILNRGATVAAAGS